MVTVGVVRQNTSPSGLATMHERGMCVTEITSCTNRYLNLDKRLQMVKPRYLVHT